MAKAELPEGYIDFQDLKVRGWTDSLVKRFLTEPDDTLPSNLPWGNDRRIWKLKRAEEAERLPSWRQKSALAKKRALGRKAAKERKELVAERLEVVSKELVIPTEALHGNTADVERWQSRFLAESEAVSNGCAKWYGPRAEEGDSHWAYGSLPLRLPTWTLSEAHYAKANTPARRYAWAASHGTWPPLSVSLEMSCGVGGCVAQQHVVQGEVTELASRVWSAVTVDVDAGHWLSLDKSNPRVYDASGKAHRLRTLITWLVGARNPQHCLVRGCVNPLPH